MYNLRVFTVLFILLSTFSICLAQDPPAPTFTIISTNGEYDICKGENGTRAVRYQTGEAQAPAPARIATRIG